MPLAQLAPPIAGNGEHTGFMGVHQLSMVMTGGWVIIVTPALCVFFGGIAWV